MDWNIWKAIKEQCDKLTAYRLSHRHEHNLSVETNPMCAKRITEKLHRYKLKHSTYLKLVDAYLKAAKKTLLELIQEEAKTIKDEARLRKQIHQLIKERRRLDYEELANYIHDYRAESSLAGLQRFRYDIENYIDEMGERAHEQLEEAMQDALTPIRLHGQYGPDRSQILQHIGNARVHCTEAVKNQKEQLEKIVFNDSMAKQKRFASIRAVDQQIETLTIVIEKLCLSLKGIASDYASSINRTAIQRQKKVASLELYKTTLLAPTKPFDNIPLCKQVVRLVSGSIEGIFDIMLAYQIQQTPVQVQQDAAKFLVEVILAETDRLIKRVQDNYSNFLRTIALWLNQLDLLKEAKEFKAKSDEVKGESASDSKSFSIEGYLMEQGLVRVPQDGSKGKCLYLSLESVSREHGDNLQEKAMKGAIEAVLTHPEHDAYEDAIALVTNYATATQEPINAATVIQSIKNDAWNTENGHLVLLLLALIYELNITVVSPKGINETIRHGGSKQPYVLVLEHEHYNSTKKAKQKAVE